MTPERVVDWRGVQAGLERLAGNLRTCLAQGTEINPIRVTYELARIEAHVERILVRQTVDATRQQLTREVRQQAIQEVRAIFQGILNGLDTVA